MDLKKFEKYEEAIMLPLADKIVSINVPTSIKEHNYHDAIMGLHAAIGAYYKYNKITEIGPLIQKIFEIYRLEAQEEMKKEKEKDRENIKKEKKKDRENLEKFFELYRTLSILPHDTKILVGKTKIRKSDYLMDLLGIKKREDDLFSDEKRRKENI